MKKIYKIFLIIFFLVSALVVIYFNFYRNYDLTPSNCFNYSDKEVLIASNNKNQLDTFLKGPSSDFYRKISDKINFKKAYLSLYKPKILIKYNSSLTDEKIESLIISIGLKFIKNNKVYKIENNWNCINDDNYLFFYKGKFRKNDKPLGLKYNSSSDFSIFKTNSNETVNYLIRNEKLVKVYPNKYQETFINKNDFNLFSKTLPEGIEHYTFYDKNYALKNQVIDKKTAFYKILGSGFCFFKFNGNEFIISDVSNKIDPYKILDDELGINEIIPGLRKRYINLFLTSETNELNYECFVDYLDGKLLFSKNKEQFELISSLISEKKSIRSSSKEYGFLFKDQPSKVVFRTSSLSEKRSIIAQKDKFREFIYRNQSSEKVKDIAFNSIENVRYIVSGKDYVYVFTHNEILKFQNEKVIERVNYKGDLIGEPEIISIEPEERLFFTTTEKLYYIDQNFKSLDDFPIILKNKPLIPFQFCAKSLDKIIGYSSKKIFSICDSKGNVKSKIDLKLENEIDPISYFISDDLTGVIYDKSRAYFINLDKNELLNSVDLIKDGIVFLTDNENQAFFYIEDNKLIRNDFNGMLKTCASGTELLKLKSFPKNKVLGVLSSKNLALFNSKGECVNKIKLPSSSINDYTIIRSYKGESFIILMDNLSNDFYIYTFGGENLLSSPIKGTKSFSINRISRNLEIYTIFKNKLIKYIK